MNRRSFVRRLAAAVIGLTLARELPGIAAAPPALPPPSVEDRDLGISIRYVRQFDVEASKHVHRFDVFMAPAEIWTPDFAVRVQG